MTATGAREAHVDSHKPHICFVAQGAYNLLSRRSDLTRIGGAEVQVVALARALRAQGHAVSFITWDYGQPDGEHCDGITVYKSYAPSAGLPGLRFLHPRWTGLSAAMKRANADLYVQPNADSITGQIAMWCKRHDRRFAFLVMCDHDCAADLPYLTTRRERWLYRHGLRQAQVIVAQTARQQALLDQQQLRSALLRPCGGRHNDDSPLVTYPAGRPRALWLGRFSFQKRLEWLLDIAERCPQIDFDVVGGANEQDVYAARMIERAKGIANVVLHGFAPHAEIDRFYARAHALVLTSPVEGFPSVFVEAWSWGLPTVASVDVDRDIRDNELGIVSDNVDELAAALGALFASRQQWQRCSDNARAWYLRHHTPAAVADGFSKLIAD